MRQRRLWIILTTGWSLLCLTCNLPFQGIGTSLPAEALKSTLQASALQTLSPTASGGDPEPEATPSPQSGMATATLAGEVPSANAVLPDSEVILSPTTVDFSTSAYVSEAGGFLSGYQEKVGVENLTGQEIIQRVAELTSTNPRFLLAFLELRSGWVFGQPQNRTKIDHPIGFNVPGQEGLYKEVSLAANQLNAGYYGWRAGTLTTLKFPDQSTLPLSPTLNAGTAAVQRLFSLFYNQAEWQTALYGPNGLVALYNQMFGDAWERAQSFGPLFPEGLSQPVLELPFPPGERWSLTGGPHYSWNAGSPRGALDFAPVTGEPACQTSTSWVTAPAPGVVTRTGEGILVLDLDGDSFEQTGWVLLFLHIADEDRANLQTHLDIDDHIGHPSCEGGHTTGTHVHLARKYNGEWIAVDGSLPFVLSGWKAVAGGSNYSGFLVKDDQTVTANPGGNRTSIIIR